MKKTLAILIFGLSTLPVSAHSVRNLANLGAGVGPCYGVGCPVLASKHTPAPSAQEGPAPTQENAPSTNTAAPETTPKHRHKFRLLHPF